MTRPLDSRYPRSLAFSLPDAIAAPEPELLLPVASASGYAAAVSSCSLPRLGHLWFAAFEQTEGKTCRGARLMMGRPPFWPAPFATRCLFLLAAENRTTVAVWLSRNVEGGYPSRSNTHGSLNAPLPPYQTHLPFLALALTPRRLFASPVTFPYAPAAAGSAGSGKREQTRFELGFGASRRNPP